MTPEMVALLQELQREAAKEADAVYREALADGMTPEEILQTVEFEFLHIHDHTTELTGTEAEEESTALALQSEIDGAREVTDVDNLPNEPGVIEGYLQSLKPKQMISRGALQKVFTHHNAVWVDYDMICKAPRNADVPRHLRHMQDKVGVLLWHSKHFIGCVASKQMSTIYIYDSLRGYSPETRDKVLAETATYFGNMWGCTMGSAFQLCAQQDPHSNDCGVHAVNNILWGLGIKGEYTREAIQQLIQSEWPQNL